MIDRPSIAPSVRAYLASPTTMIVLDARGDLILHGDIFARVVPLLDGTRAVDEIADALEGDFGAAEVFYALRYLESHGCIVDGAVARVLADRANHALTPLSVVVVHDLLDDALSAMSNVPGSWVVVCRDGDGSLLISPRFAGEPTGPCPSCLEHRLYRARPAAAFVRARQLEQVNLRRHHVSMTAAQWDSVRPHVGDAAHVTFIAVNGTVTRHPVHRRPECPRCGDATLYAATARQRVTLREQTNAFVPSWEARERMALEFDACHADLLDPLTGMAREVVTLAGAGDAFHVVISGCNPARPSSTIAALEWDLRRMASGKGRSPAMARASLLGELAERHSGVHRGDEPRTVASAEELGAAAMDVNGCMLFSDRQLESRERNTTAEDPIPLRFDPRTPISWTEVWSLTHDAHRFLPTGYLYYEFPYARAEPFCIADSNGNAAGSSIEDAVLQALLEIVERDAAGIWWYNRIARKEVELETVNDAWVHAVVSQFASVGRSCWVLDLTTDLEIPVFVAVSRRSSGPFEELLLGFGAHPDASIALSRAVSELAQTYSVWTHLAARELVVAPTLREWSTRATLARDPYLAPHGRVPLPVQIEGRGLRWCMQRIASLGHECLVLDQTRPDVGVPTVKVIVPGMRHFRRRLAPGRLYDIPVQMGWRETVLQEHEMNSAVFPF